MPAEKLSKDEETAVAAMRGMVENYVRCGVELVPVRPRTKRPYNPAHPKGENWEQYPFTDPKQAGAHWDEHQHDNASWLMGDCFVALDFDVQSGKQGRRTLAWLAQNYPAIRATLTQRSPSGGWHKFFELKPAQRGKLGKHANANLGPWGKQSGLDIIAGAATVLLEPSRTMSGEYRWKNQSAEVLEMPDDLFALLIALEKPGTVGRVKLDPATTALLRWGWFDGCGHASPREARAAAYRTMMMAGLGPEEIAAEIERSLLRRDGGGKQKDLTAEALREDIGRVLAQPPEPVLSARGSTLDTLDRAADKKILASEANLAHVLANPDICGMAFMFDLFQQGVLVAERGSPTCRALEESDYAEVRVRLSNAGFQRIAKDLIRDLIFREAMINKFDSAQTWLSALGWDGMPRIEEFLPRYLGTEDSPYHRGIGLYWWTAMAGRVMKPGVKADMAPILVGKQGLKKSTALQRLVPEEMHFAEISLSTKDEELTRLVQGKLICEMAELSGLFGRDRDATKAYLTKQYDRARPLYESHVVSYPRRFIICGTTNEDDFLSDPTGERRWLPFTVGKIDLDAITRDRDQLWAEAREMFARAGVAHAVPGQLEGQRDFRRASVLAESLEEWIAHEAPNRPFTLSEAIAGVTGDLAVNTKKHEKAYTDALKELGFASKQSRVNGEKKRYWVQERTHDSG
ncbi:bifunctional DNA primase/polymerase [Paraburkholderia sp. CNPSo 3076]|uniref:VapE domain-containing protein n=1 Tax=Paraburkholderia sp. CNPSo 3076 TaxID=2940936 RepID=UPI00225A9E7A|nr:VapE domain-containing protein [Paraburkholderia sp. CNPSo 3076]MCX5542591.1 bifunctional DNA primase/polymerase [Paraburkholderia sp. CNPSo 3076]